jgi:hypothetical protein
MDATNKDELTEEMKEFGIYVLDQDAEWEADDAFGDQLQQHDRCDAQACLCPDGKRHPEAGLVPEGRKYDEEDTEWEIMLCVCCGHQGMHVRCGGLSLARPRWKCPFCRDVVQHLPNRPVPVLTRVKRAAGPLPDRAFTRGVLTNLTFTVSNTVIEVAVHKNRSDPRDEAVARFRVTPAPRPPNNLPEPVAVRRKEEERKGDTVRNIPCPMDDCHQLLSRLEFHSHLAAHREEGEEEPATIASGRVVVGGPVQVMEGGQLYAAKVLQLEAGRCLVHYKGWAAKWDTWLERPGQEGEDGVSCQSSVEEDVQGEGGQVEGVNKEEAQKEGAKKDKEAGQKGEKAEKTTAKEKAAPAKRKPSAGGEEGQGPPAKKLRPSVTAPGPESEGETPKPAKRDSASSGKKGPTTSDEKQSSILSFFKRFKPTVDGSPELKEKKSMKRKIEDLLNESSDQVEILEKVTPTKVETKVVSSSVGFFKLDSADIDISKEDFKCDLCGAEFSDSGKLAGHQESHR